MRRYIYYLVKNQF